MTSQQNSSATPSRDTSSTSPDAHRPSSSTFSASKSRHSYVSSETAESSSAASLRDTLLNDGSQDGVANDSLTVDMASRDGKGSFRSHRSRNSGGFLLSNTTFEPPSRDVTPPKSSSSQRSWDYKGKSVLRSPEKKHTKRKSNTGLGLAGSPLAGHVTTAASQEAEDVIPKKDETTTNEGTTSNASTNASPGILDVDSTQIVNLALNLSESRRNVSRRLLSTPLPIAGFAENMTGGSMRYHMQQQRRPSRNISPKPDRGEKNLSISSRIPSGARLNSPLQPAFDLQQEGQYQYHFSTSTLARAEKAKNALELMAQYRELLHYLPPLKSQRLERTITATTLNYGTGSPYLEVRKNTSNGQPDSLGRQYNPLQYIRNRKVRARMSKTIDGDLQGFADIDKVTEWVQAVSKESKSPDYQAADCVLLPSFNTLESSVGQPASPNSTLGKGNTIAKLKRPRIDWVTNPSDMLADLFWLEQDDNKKVIEDRLGRRILPQHVELRRPMSRQETMQDDQKSSNPLVVSPESEKEVQAETRLPQFKSIKQETENFAEKGASRAREKLRHVRDAARIHHHNGSGRDVRQFLRSRSKSDTSSSASDSDHKPRRKRSGTADSHDRGKDILAKQMAEMLEKETKISNGRAGRDHQGRRDAVAPGPRDSSGKHNLKGSGKRSASHSRSASLANHSKRNSLMNASSGRASLDVPGTNPRGSLDIDLDTTAPNSPELRASRASDFHIPSISMDLNSPRSRHSSPTRRALSKVRAKIRPIHERNYNSDHSSIVEDTAVVSQFNPGDLQPETPEKRRRSMSPIKKLVNRKAGDAISNANKTGNVRRDRAEDPSGIRGFLKSARNPVSRVGGMIWKRESPGHGFSSGVSTDESDVEESQEVIPGEISAGKFDDLARAYPRKESPSYLKDMPSFVSPFEGRGRSTQSHHVDRVPNPLFDIKEDRTRRKESPKAYPLINVQSPGSSPEFAMPKWGRRSSSASDFQRGSFPSGVQQADSRLNSILGYPGKRRNSGLPITGLAGLDISNRRPSMQGKRQWSISDQAVSVTHGPTTRREIARVRALLLSSGIKAKEISRRGAALTDLRHEKPLYSELVPLAQRKLSPVPRSQEHILAGQILSDDIQLSAKLWQESTDNFCNATVASILTSIETLHCRVAKNLTPMTRKAADEADEVSKDLVSSQTLNVKRTSDKIEKMIRTRRRRFRWLRRGGWVLVEWALVGVMWYVWFIVVLCRIVFGIGHGIMGSLRWLLFL